MKVSLSALPDPALYCQSRNSLVPFTLMNIHQKVYKLQVHYVVPGE